MIFFLILKKSSHFFLNNANGIGVVKSAFKSMLSTKIFLLFLLNLSIKNNIREETL